MYTPVIHEVAIAPEDGNLPYSHYYSFGSYDDFNKEQWKTYAEIHYDAEKGEFMCEHIRITRKRAEMFMPIVGRYGNKHVIHVNYYNQKRWWQ
jgi:hypothetical protein